MKNQALFSLKDKTKKIKMSSAAIFVWRFKGFEKKVVGFFRSALARTSMSTKPSCFKSRLS